MRGRVNCTPAQLRGQENQHGQIEGLLELLTQFRGQALRTAFLSLEWSALELVSVS